MGFQVKQQEQVKQRRLDGPDASTTDTTQDVQSHMERQHPETEETGENADGVEQFLRADAYIPPVHDDQDQIIDDLLEQLHSAQLQQKENELMDDTLVDFLDDVAEFASEEPCTATSEDNDVNRDPHIFEGSKRTLGVAVLLLCCFMVRFRLPDEAMNYLLSLLSLLLPDDSKVPKTLYQMRQFFNKHVPLPEIKYYCSWCYAHVERESTTCSNKHCLRDLTGQGAMSHFVLHSCISQIRTMFQRKSFTDSVRTHRFAHMSKGGDSLSDVYDGENYKKLYQSGFLSDPNSLSFGMNTDGVAIFKSSRVSMWPVYLMINELPLKQRKARENMIFYGFWISSKKPLMWSFLKPMYDELQLLEKGIMVKDYEGNVVKCQATILTCTCDLPAKCLVSNSVQFNGKYGCWYCLQPGETFKTGERGCCHIFPFQKHDPKGPARTMKSLLEDVNETVSKIQSGEKSYTSNGIKGPSWLMFLKYFNAIDGYVIDYMHGVCAGVMKTLLARWFSKEHKS